MPSHAQVALEHQDAVVHAVNVAALVAVAGINTRADQTVADVHTAAQCCLHIGAIEGVNVHRIVGTGLFAASISLPTTS